MSAGNFNVSRNWGVYQSIMALLVSVAAHRRSGVPNPPAQNTDAWKAERQSPPLVFSTMAWLDCSSSSTENGKQAMTTTSGQDSFDSVILPLKSSRLQLIS